VASKGDHARDVLRTPREQPFPGLAAMRALKVARYCVEDGDVRGRYERVLDRFEALGPIELKGVADPVPLFRAASS
jgi:hypothetical protein